jgi:REP element-mobilizing transposase RayT
MALSFHGRKVMKSLRHKKYVHVSPNLSANTWMSLSLDYRWKMFATAFRMTRKRIPFELHAFLLLETHCHILFSYLPEEEITPFQVLDEIHRALILLIEPAPGVDLLKKPFIIHEIETRAELLNAYHYIYRNPLSAELTSDVMEYRYSSLRQLLGLENLNLPVSDPLFLISHPKRALIWLNGVDPQLHPRADLKHGSKTTTH